MRVLCGHGYKELKGCPIKQGDKVKLKDSAFEVLPKLSAEEYRQVTGVLTVDNIFPIELNEGTVYDITFVEVGWSGITNEDVIKV